MIVTQMDHEDAGFHVSGAAQVREQLVRIGFDILASRFPPTRLAS